MTMSASPVSTASTASTASSCNPTRPTLDIFATVGTTRFDLLLHALLSRSFLSSLSQLRLPASSPSTLPSSPSIAASPRIRLTIQYGNSSIGEILSSSSLVSIDDDSQLIPEPGLRVIEGRRVYQNRVTGIAALDPGRTGTLHGLRIRRPPTSLQKAEQECLPSDPSHHTFTSADDDTAKSKSGSEELLEGTLQATTEEGVELELFAFRPDLAEYVRRADVVISHAGAGTILETLRGGDEPPALIVVPNTALMDNHQAELALALGKEGYLIAGDESRLAEQIQQALLDRRSGNIVPFPAFQPERFRKLVDELMGFD